VTGARLRAAIMNWTELDQAMGRDESRCELCPLSRVKAGVAVRIKQLCAAPELQNRLRELGFCEDQIIRLLTSQANFICQVCNARLAISEQLARIILVEPLQPALARSQPTPRQGRPR
jgi:Fe2+ transport system protein FeoA